MWKRASLRYEVSRSNLSTIKGRGIFLIQTKSTSYHAFAIFHKKSIEKVFLKVWNLINSQLYFNSAKRNISVAKPYAIVSSLVPCVISTLRKEPFLGAWSATVLLTEFCRIINDVVSSCAKLPCTLTGGLSGTKVDLQKRTSRLCRLRLLKLDSIWSGRRFALLFTNVDSQPGADPSSKVGGGGRFQWYLVVKSHNGFATVREIREMQYTEQHCCGKTLDDKVALYRQCCFPNCTKSWWIQLVSYV